MVAGMILHRKILVINTYLKFNKTYIILKFLHEPNGITENLSLLITKNVQILQKTEHEKRWKKREWKIKSTKLRYLHKQYTILV